MPLHHLRSLPLPDLHLYQRYTARRGFPGRRIEMLLAQVSLVLARVNGADTTDLREFLFDPPAPQDSRIDPPDRDLSGFFD